MPDRSQRPSRCGWVTDTQVQPDSTGMPLIGTVRQRQAGAFKKALERDRERDVPGASRR